VGSGDKVAGDVQVTGAGDLRAGDQEGQVTSR